MSVDNSSSFYELDDFFFIAVEKICYRSQDRSILGLIARLSSLESNELSRELRDLCVFLSDNREISNLSLPSSSTHQPPAVLLSVFDDLVVGLPLPRPSAP